MTERRCDVLVVGGGPVGLFLALCLDRLGIGVTVCERRQSLAPESRSIGIHPVSLEYFAMLGLVDDLVAAGEKVVRGHAFVERRLLGQIDFANCPPPFNFVLTVPQPSTEAILERALAIRAPGALHRGVEVVSLVANESEVAVTTIGDDGQRAAFCARYVVGCDGSRSAVRAALAIPWDGSPYPDHYIMGDFADPDPPPRDAMIYLHHAGLVESFPLPSAQRRWVVKTDGPLATCTATDLVDRVRDRVGVDLTGRSCAAPSAFGVQRFLARQFVAGRVALAGDAAHVLSPIGGQGMNLGWLDAWDLALCLDRARRDPARTAPVLAGYEQRRRRAARCAQRRAEFNTILGRRFRRRWPRAAIAWLITHRPLAPFMARRFTMRGLTTEPAPIPGGA